MWCGVVWCGREARLQVELAELQFKASRLVRGRDESGARAKFAGGVEVRLACSSLLTRFTPCYRDVCPFTIVAE
jgi:hypothetical protein